MSRTKKGTKAPGYEFWSARPGKGKMSSGPIAKKLTHRAERQEGKQQARDER